MITQASRAGGQVAVYGASDDLIELTGSVFDEADAVSGRARVEFGHGPVLELDGTGTGPDGGQLWRVTVVDSGGQSVVVVPARGEAAGNDEHDCPGYSEKALLDVPGSTTVKVVELQ